MSDRSLTQLFEAQVARTPHDPAVFFEDASLTYQQLNAYSNQLAHYLQRLGVGPDVLVGVYMERSLEMIIALLGILKAGGAYVPLDPTYPSERIAFMLEDIAIHAATQQPILLAQSHLVPQLPSHNAHLLCIAIENGEYDVNNGRDKIWPLQSSMATNVGRGVSLPPPACPVNGNMCGHTGGGKLTPLPTFARIDKNLCQHSIGATLHVIDRHDEVMLTSNITNPTCLATADNLAYVIYTSGSTGKPKGVMNTHRGICNRLLWIQEAYPLTSADTVLQKAPFSFDISVGEFFWPLLTGARLVIARPEGQKDSAYLLSLIRKHQVTVLHFGPAMLQIFMQEPTQEPCSSLRHVICGGEPLPYELQERFFARYTASLHNHYGPTEATIDVATWTCQRDSERYIIPIGYPIANTQLYILDPQGQPVPVGVQGELYIGGIAVARGYLNRPQLTAERFVPDPFSTLAGARLYRTGDIARYLPDGAIEYLGRLDQQVKLHGFRIELGEIETVLTHHPAIREAVVTVREDVPGDKRLVAYIVFHKELHATITEMQQYMHQHVPSHMAPALFVELPAFPLNNSDKVDRRALPVPGSMRPDLLQPFVAPRTAIEATIADTWSQVLGVHPVGVDDDFFALGGQSLLAMRITILLRSLLQVEFPLRSFFAAPTVAQFAELVDQLKSHKDAPSLPQLQTLPQEKATSSRPGSQDTIALPSSFAQQRLWFIDQLDPNNAAYNIPATIHFKGQLDICTLQKSLTEITQRHDVLRTTFTQLDGQPMQVIAPTAAVAPTYVDLQQLPEDERAIALQSALMQEAAKPFDLVQGPLWRIIVFCIGSKQYTLSLLIHHIIADGWSVGLFFQELTTLYTAFSTNQPAILPTLPIQYAEFAAWQRDSLQADRLAEHLHYWKQQLAGAPEMLELPTDFSRPLAPTHQGATYTFTLSHQLTEPLRALSRQEGVTLYITLVTAFQLLLHRYTGQDDLVIGTATADRVQPEVQNLLGLFLNIVALRTSFAGSPTVQDMLIRVRDVVLDAHAHQDLPFERLVQELNLERSVGHSPLFQVSLQLDPPSPSSSTQWTLTRIPTGTTATKFDLSLELEDHPSGLIGHLEYSTDLFTESTIAHMAMHWQTLLASMVADPTQSVASLPLLTDAEQKRLLVELNNTSMPYAAETCFHQLFEAQAALTPTQVAVVFEASQLTYQELNARANQFAHYLLSLGVGPDILVGICIERSLNMLVALLGILKAGGAYLPLDPSYPAERIAFMLDDAQITVLVTQQSLVATDAINLVPTHSTEVVCMDTDQKRFIHLSETNPTTSVTSSHIAYVIYTSGSTGRPKGVQIPHRALVNFLLSMRQAPGISAQDTLLAVTTLSFDIAGLELYLPLIVGARLIIASRDVATSGIALAETLANTHTTMMQATPITWRMLLSTDWQAHAPLKILCGGEALPLELARQLVAHGASLYNMYGPTETTIWSTLRKIEATDTPISIGRPIANTTIYILDQHLQLVPMGVAGELYIGGDGLARGYLKRPELTAERFIRHPFSSNPTDRLYSTGDVARYRNDGTIELIGRVDHQIKLRGFRIELGEVESVLEQHPAVQQAVALVREDHPDDKRLVAYLLLRAGQHITLPELQQHGSAHLPNYMVPSLFVLLDQLPQTPNGKVDRRALPVPDQIHLDAQEIIVAPRTPLEEVVADIWARVLGIAQVGIHDNFFALGGHSLLAMQVTSQLHTALQIDLPLRSFFDAPTVAQLAEHITQARGSIRKQPDIQRQRKPLYPDNTLIFPASSAQQALWFIDHFDPGNTAYNLHATLQLHKSLQLEVLKQSLDVLVQRHKALRTTFITVDDRVVQFIAPSLDIPITIKDLQQIPASEQVLMLHQLATQELQRPFDLAQGPLLRASVFHLNENKHVLFLVMHHIISDGWSINLLLQEFVTLYETFTDNLGSKDVNALVSVLENNHDLMPPELRDFVAWQQEWLQSEMFSEALSYWKQHLTGAPAILALPTDRPRPAQPTYKGDMHTFALSLDLSTALKTFSRQENVTLYMTLVAAFFVLLQRYVDQEDLLLGTATSGRAFTETQSLIGYITNTLVLRADLSGNPTVHELLERVREIVLQADAHQHLPFDILVKELLPNRSQTHNALFRVFLTLDPSVPTFTADYNSTQQDLATGATKFDLSLELADRPTGIVGHLEYSTDLFEASTITRMAGHWQTLLHVMIDDPTHHLSELPLLTDIEHLGRFDQHVKVPHIKLGKEASQDATYVAPHLPIHHQLMQIWEELLHVRSIGIRDNFFALGGHSFLAIRLMTRIEQVYGKRLPLSTLFNNATIEHLASTLLSENYTSSTIRTPITAVQAGGSKPPFFFLHGDWQGKALYCLKLSQALGAQQPFYILETYKYDDLKVLPTLEEVATAYIAAIRTIQPEGPYRLGGWCNGAVFAYEIAQQLQVAGQQVDMLVLMDPGSSTTGGSLIKKIIKPISRLLHFKQEQQVDIFLRLLHLYEYVRLWNERRKEANILRKKDTEEALAEIEAAHTNFQWLLPSRTHLRQNYISIFNWWASSYKVRPYAGKIALFWTEEDDRARRHYWDSFLASHKEVDVYVVPGNHVTSRTKYAGALAESLRVCLSERDTGAV